MGTKAARCVCLAMAALLIVTTVLVTPALADDGSINASNQGRVLRVAFPKVEGFTETDDNGVRSGSFYDWLTEIAKYTGWKYEFVDGDINDLSAKVAAGEIDLIGGMYYREQLASTFRYSHLSLGSDRASLIALESNHEMSTFDVRTLEGKTIGVYKNASEKIRRLENYLDLNALHCTVVPLDHDAFATCLEERTVDMVLGGDVDVTEGRKVVAQFDGEPYYIAMPPNSDLKDEVDAAMTSIYTADPGFACELDAKHLHSHHQYPIQFSDADKAYLEQTDVINVAVIKDRYPLFYKHESQDRGIVKDMLDLITDRVGVKFRYVQANNYQDAINLVKSGQADIMGGFMDDEHVADGQQLSITKSFATLNEVVFHNKRANSKDSVFAQLDGREGSDGVDATEIVHYRTYEDCLEAVNSGRADVTIMPVAYAESLFTTRSFGNITPATLEHHESSLSFALAQPVDAQLYSVLSKAVNSFSQDELDTIFSRNAMPSFGKQRTLQAIASDNPLLVVALGLVLCLLIGAIVVVMSVAKVRNRMMEMKLEKVEEMGRAKTDFLSRMSHEIRTPMNAIIGLSNVASLSGEATPSIRSSLEKINMSAQFLLSLVNDILDMSKIENDKMHIETSALCLHALAERLQSMFCIQAEDKGVILEAHCDAEGVVVVDDVRLQQVLANLLSNALKFTDPGDTVLLSIVSLMRDEGRVRVRFSVKDSGAGIREEDLARIFVSFEQASESRRNAQGTGLGLAISSNLVRLMGGKLDVQSRFGEGSEFFFVLDLPPGDEEAAAKGLHAGVPSVSERSLAGTRVLLAEDNDLNAEIAVALLEMQGVETQRAANGREAVDFFAASKPGSFDFVLMDVKMPLLDGLEAAVEIRALPRDDARTVPIIALTANTFQEDREDAAAAGMDGFIPKPFDAQQLYDVLRSFLPPEEGDRSAT